MAKCICPPTGKSSKAPGSKRGGKQSGKQMNKVQNKKAKGKKRVPNMFILYFLDMYKKHGGNMYCVARECGRRWKTLPQSEKDKYKRQYCAKCKACKSCTRSTSGSSGSGSSGGSKKTGGSGSGGNGC